MQPPRYVIIKEDELEVEEYRYYCTYDTVVPILEQWHLAIGEWDGEEYKYIIIKSNSLLYPIGYRIKHRSL